MSATRKVPALDGLRILAIAAIIIYHANATWLPGGYFGVTVFFVLTGYLITLSIERSMSKRGGFDYLRFMMRRVARMLPSMLVLVGVVALLCALFSQALLPKVQSDAIPALQNISADYHIPILYLSYDTQTSDTGIETRLEAFYDMLSMKRTKTQKQEEKR